MDPVMNKKKGKKGETLQSKFIIAMSSGCRVIRND